MNRRERRAQQAQAKAPHPTQSFAELVGQTSLDRLKPFIAEAVQVLGANLARQQLSALGNTLTRLSVLEGLVKEKLGETDDSLASRVADREDEALGLVTSTEPAKAGDQVRISFRGYEEGKPNDQPLQRAVLRKAAVEPLVFPREIEEGILGALGGETRSIVLDTGSRTDHETGEEKKNPNLVFEVRVDRVSVSKPVPKAPEITAAAPAPELSPGEGNENS